MNVFIFGINNNIDINKRKFGLLQFLIAGSSCVVDIVDIQTGCPEYNLDFIAKNINRYTAHFKTQCCVNTMYFSKNDAKTIEWVNKNHEPCQHGNSIIPTTNLISHTLFWKIVNYLADNPITDINTIYTKKNYTCHYGFNNTK